MAPQSQHFACYEKSNVSRSSGGLVKKSNVASITANSCLNVYEDSLLKVGSQRLLKTPAPAGKLKRDIHFSLVSYFFVRLLQMASNIVTWAVRTWPPAKCLFLVLLLKFGGLQARFYKLEDELVLRSTTTSNVRLYVTFRYFSRCQRSLT